MPELPEVETVVRELHPLLKDRRITGVRVGRKALRRRWSKGWAALLTGRRFGTIGRRGKWIVLYLSKGLSLVIHLGMTGQLTVVPADEPADEHTHVVFTLNGRKELRFRDIRRFGSVRVFTSPEAVHDFFRELRLGPEPWGLRPTLWRAQLARTSRCLKAVLLDQRMVAGLGNIYADESLFESRLHPARLACTLGPDEAKQLANAVKRVVNRAIKKRGSSIRNYIGGSGRKGAYQKEFRVYGRAGAPCPHCGTPIICVRLAGRATHFCPDCQKPPRAKAQRRKGGQDGC